MSISFVFGSQRKRSFQWNMDFRLEQVKLAINEMPDRKAHSPGTSVFAHSNSFTSRCGIIEMVKKMYTLYFMFFLACPLFHYF